MLYLSSLKKEELAGKTCLLRINLDIKNPEKDSSRLDAVIPTIKFLLDSEAKILILSHRGRPPHQSERLLTLEKERSHGDGASFVDSQFSLSRLIKILEKKVGQKIDYLENLRFDPREQANDENFAKELASKGDLYINDDFATSHRVSASMVGITKFLPSYAGLLLEQEIKNLSRAMENPQKPLVIIIGGIKIDDKVGMIEHFMNTADYFLMGSAYLGIMNKELGIRDVKKVIFPQDSIRGDGKDLDIGPKTVEQFCKIISTAKTIIWNGPVGMFENPKYLDGSKKIAEAVIDSGAFSVIGGGDTDQLLNQLGIKNKFGLAPSPQGEVRGFISTGGGAMLEFLSGKKLPAIEALG